LLIKVKPNTVDGTAVQQLRAALAGRKLDMQEPVPGAWKIQPLTAGGKS
jgi:general secretion pathway protein L